GRAAGDASRATDGRGVAGHAAELDNAVYIAGPQAARAASLDEATEGVSPAAAIAGAPGAASAAKRRRGQRDAVDAQRAAERVRLDDVQIPSGGVAAGGAVATRRGAAAAAHGGIVEKRRAQLDRSADWPIEGGNGDRTALSVAADAG